MVSTELNVELCDAVFMKVFLHKNDLINTIYLIVG